jgi:hypothetical protein
MHRHSTHEISPAHQRFNHYCLPPFLLNEGSDGTSRLAHLWLIFLLFILLVYVQEEFGNEKVPNRFNVVKLAIVFWKESFYLDQDIQPIENVVVFSSSQSEQQHLSDDTMNSFLLFGHTFEINSLLNIHLQHG